MKHLLFILMAIVGLVANAEGYENMTVNGKTRKIWVHTPEGLPENPPLVISFHGAYGTGEGQHNDTRWDAVADTAKFVVVYPDGIDNWWDVYGNSDLQFVEKIIDLMHTRYNIDLTRVYASGFSLGSMFTYHCAEHLANKIAAFGPVSGVRFDGRAPASTRRVPIIHTHGTNDDVFKWGGDPGHMAGGYPAISEYVEKWAKYNKLDAVPEVVDPYRNCTRTTWSDENSMIEVTLLAVKGVGHWHSEGSDWGDISTSREIWEFVKRYRLGYDPIAPALVSVEPENESFDLLSDTHRSFAFKFDKDVDLTKAEAVLSKDGSNIPLTCAINTDKSAAPTYMLPAGVNVPDGYYTLTLSNVQSPEGGKVKSLSFNYTYGITEVSEKIQADTIYWADWDATKDKIGEGIPNGWRRTLTRGDETDTQSSGAANVSGPRVMYFPQGGDFTSGFYFSARDYDKCELSYGKVNGYTLTLQPGTYDLRFRSSYWNAGSESANATFSVNIAPRVNGSAPIFNVTGLKSGSSLNESKTTPVKGSKIHELSFEVKDKNRYALNFEINQGWNAVILGAISITSHQIAPDKYKGGLYRLLIEANQVANETAEAMAGTAELAALQDCINKYEGFTSTAPSEYNAAIDELTAAIEAVRNALKSGIAEVEAPMSEAPVYNAQGIMVKSAANAADLRQLPAGLYIHGSRKVIVR